MWLYLSALSAVFLGLYDISRKHALRANAVLPVFFFATLAETIILAPLLIFSAFSPGLIAGFGLYVPPADLTSHLFFVLKAIIVGTLLLLGYCSMKHLPISIFSPIAASSPAWTLVGAVLLFGERLSGLQWLAFGILFISYYIFSVVGSREGIVFHTNKWVILLFMAILLGSSSALFDKYLVQVRGMHPLAVQVWFCVYLVPMLAVGMLVFWYPRRASLTPFNWRWTVPLIGMWLAVADVAYFKAIACDGALISLIAAIRSAGALVSFTAGAFIFKEVQMHRKAIALAGVLSGVILLFVTK